MRIAKRLVRSALLIVLVLTVPTTSSVIAEDEATNQTEPQTGASPDGRVRPIGQLPTPTKEPATGAKKPATGAQKARSSAQKARSKARKARARRRSRLASGGPMVRSGPASGSTSSVSGTPVSNRSRNIIIAGDIAECDDGDPGETQTAALVESLSGIVMTAGDNVYAKGTLEEFKDCYGPTWGRFLDRTRPTPGNHDYYTPNASGYFEYFGDRAGQPGQGYYTFAAASWRVYSLSSGFCMTEAGCGPGTAQYDWLKEQLAAHPVECVLAVWHEPRFSSGRHGQNPEVLPLARLLYQEGAELVVNGHDHSYERFAPARPNGRVDRKHGVRQFVSGSGGSDHYPRGSETSPHSEAFDNTSYGVLRLSLHPGSYDWDFIPVAGSDFTDAGSGTCHGKP